MEDTKLITLLPEWLGFSKESPIDPGMSREEAVALAWDVLQHLEQQGDCDVSSIDQDKMKDVFHALTSRVLPRCTPDIRVIDAAYRLVNRFPWCPHEKAEKLELSRQVSDLGWRSLGMDAQTVRQLRMSGTDPHVSVPDGTNQPRSGQKAPEAVVDLFGGLKQSTGESIGWLFEYCRELWKRFEYGVSPIHRESVEAWERLSGNDRLGLFDEAPFFRGELARMAGVTCRFEGRWDEAEQWFGRAEKEYLQTLDADVGLAQLAFARIGLLYHRYEYVAVVENAERLSRILNHLGMQSRAEKCRLAGAMALKALGRVDEAIVILEQLAEGRGGQSPSSFLIHLHTHLADAYKERGRIPEADRCLQKGADVLPSCERTIAAADFRLVYADHLRARGDFSTAAEIFALAREGYSVVGMRPFAAYASVLLAETLMMLDRRAAAESELYSALPVLEELNMLPEGCAAVALLQEALRLRRLDHDVLRAFRTSLKM